MQTSKRPDKRFPSTWALHRFERAGMQHRKELTLRISTQKYFCFSKSMIEHMMSNVLKDKLVEIAYVCIYYIDHLIVFQFFAEPPIGTHYKIHLPPNPAHRISGMAFLNSLSFGHPLLPCERSVTAEYDAERGWLYSIDLSEDA